MSTEQENKPKVNKKALVAIAVVAGAAGITFMGSGNKQMVEQLNIEAKPIEVGSDPLNQISLQDRDAALTQFAKQFESLEQKMLIKEQESAAREKRLQAQMQANQNKLQSEVAALTDELVALRAGGIDKIYQDVNAIRSGSSSTPPALPALPPGAPSMDGLNFEGLNFDMSPPVQQVAPQSTNPYGPNYFILKPHGQTQTTTNTSGGNALSSSEEELFHSMSQPAPQSRNFGTANAGQSANAQQLAPQQYASPAEAFQAQQQAAQGSPQQVYLGPRMERIEIPAFSFVEVTTLHGVACPVGANSPGTQTQIPARPVVLPVRGIFRGPNGASVDVGTIHLMGLCSGRRTSSNKAGRATIRVEQMSYWDESGASQMANSTGYIVDTRDNEQDVYGRLDKASGRTLALESSAAAAAAFASSLSQAEYTTQRSLDSNGASSTSVLTGDATKAAISQGVASLFTKIAQRFEQEANAAIDTVVVEPGIRLRFVTDQPIFIFTPAEAFDIDAGAQNVLL